VCAAVRGCTTEVGVLVEEKEEKREVLCDAVRGCTEVGVFVCCVMLCDAMKVCVRKLACLLTKTPSGTSPNIFMPT
jgi:hypothetical protein